MTQCFAFFLIVQYSSPADNLHHWYLRKGHCNLSSCSSSPHSNIFKGIKKNFLIISFFILNQNWFKYHDSITISIFTFVSSLQCHSISLLEIKINCTFYIKIWYSYFLTQCHYYTFFVNLNYIYLNIVIKR